MLMLKHGLRGNQLIGGGSITTHLNYLNRNCSIEEGASALAANLKFKTKTKPAKYGARCAAFIGACFEFKESLDNPDRSLDMVIAAINLNNH